MMMTTERPSILVIDDKEQDSETAALGLSVHATTTVAHPQDVEILQLENADLVLVDYKLDDWSERDEQPVSLRPTTGMALANVLREQADRSESGRLTAFALLTGLISDIQGRLPSETAQHVLARMNNLEWVFTKGERGGYDRMMLLARAVRQLPRKWPSTRHKSDSTARRLLGMKKKSKWFDRCWLDVQDCRVPANEMTSGRHGILFIRWLLHQVLPYPCFLWEEHWVAARLRITVDALREVLKGNSALSRDLESMRYSGILAEFLGGRWWRGALEDYVWNLGGGHRTGKQEFRDALAERAGMDLEPIDYNPAVVCLDRDLTPSGRFLTPMDAVTLRPDHWPAFADSPWIDISTVNEDPDLRSMVNPLDLHRVGSNPE